MRSRQRLRLVEVKRETFYGDDGVEAIPLAEIKIWLASSPKPTTLAMTLTPETYQLPVPAKSPRKVT